GRIVKRRVSGSASGPRATCPAGPQGSSSSTGLPTSRSTRIRVNAIDCTITTMAPIASYSSHDGHDPRGTRPLPPRGALATAADAGHGLDRGHGLPGFLDDRRPQ